MTTPGRVGVLSRFPHPLALLVGCIALAAALTWVLPAGEFSRRDDAATGRSVVVPGTFRPVPAAPVTPFGAVVAIPRGLADAGAVVFFVFLVGGAFAVVDQTAALKHGVTRLARALSNREALVIPVVCVAFAAGGAMENMQEEIIAFVPVLLLLTRRLGFDSLTAAAISVGAAAVGSAFSPVNPFQVGIAQKLAQLPQLSAWGFRSLVLAVTLSIWILGTIRHARRNRIPPVIGDATAESEDAGTGRHSLVLALVLASFAMLVVGILRFGWDFEQMAALFFVMGIAAGLVSGLGINGTAAAFVEGFRSMAGAAMIIGFARAITLVLADGRILDTIVHGMFAPLAHMPLALSAVAMTGMQAAVHVPVPSVSGQAVLTMPILVPLSDLLGLSRQLTVFAYEIGAGLCELLTPTNGALMAILAAAGVSFGRWMRFAGGLCLLLGLVGVAALLLGIALGVS